MGPRSRKMMSRFNVVFEIRFGRRFFTPEIDFSSILEWFVEAKNLVSICILQYILDFGHSRMRFQKTLKKHEIRYF